MAGPLVHGNGNRVSSSEGEEGGSPEESKMDVTVQGRALQFHEAPIHRDPSDVPVFKSHHESSTIELFYDLFFVANLTTFTANHEITTSECMALQHESFRS